MADHTFRLSSGRLLGFAEHGDPAGVPCFYFHGWPSARVQGELMDEAGRKHGLRIISADRPGIGLSDFQPGRELKDWPPVLAELADHLGIQKFHVLGWSGGGPYVLMTAKTMPERLLSATIMCGAPPLTFLGYEHMFWLYRLMIKLRYAFPTVLAVLLRMGEKISKGEPDRAPLKWVLGMLGPADRKVLARREVFSVVRAGMLEALRRGPRAVIADADIYLSEWGFEVGEIGYPIHFWHGKEDRNIDWQYTQKLAGIMPHTTTHWLDHEGHYSLPVTYLDDILKQALGK
ncbi:pimeloyl-ACP methyl ester carboxylesterase [Prosthecobacter fusiformis]|uniref:Pimeloyl-ACP methyl ester carboxylesterase n=1 Tax=Prosthecobacter fusiformis TaxID=48464 RepID=A0A4R7RIZ9_9BACT|nr:alpha/beta hydrolase [Prosthecobacter fusiformis]TDU64117.1 pimeloyl-ACP methyl ester carboxylesterase [Prosthecobacter fusiformis]